MDKLARIFLFIVFVYALILGSGYLLQRREAAKKADYYEMIQREKDKLP